MVLPFFRFLLAVGACLTSLPALQLIYERKRHFEVYIALFQLVAGVIYSGLDSLTYYSTFLYVHRDEWHKMSDVLTETYICLLGLHLMGIRREGVLQVARYVAFTGSWIAKYGDGWSSIWLEALVMSLYILPPLFLFGNHLDPSGGINSSNIFEPINRIFPGKGNEIRAFFSRRYNYQTKIIPQALLFLSLGVLLLLLELNFDTEYRLFYALAHCAFGGSSYFLWQLLPCYDKEEDLLSFQ